MNCEKKCFFLDGCLVWIYESYARINWKQVLSAPNGTYVLLYCSFISFQSHTKHKRLWIRLTNCFSANGMECRLFLWWPRWLKIAHSISEYFYASRCLFLRGMGIGRIILRKPYRFLFFIFTVIEVFISRTCLHNCHSQFCLGGEFLVQFNL